MSEVWEIIHTQYVVLIMVLARVSGIFSFNPIFARNGVPGTVKAAATFMLALVMTIGGNYQYTLPDGLLPFVFDLGKELLVGAVLGFYVNLMLQVFSLAGEVSDMQLGLSMAKSYDPTFGSTSISTQYYSYWFILYFFVTGSHLSYIRLFSISYETIPIGYDGINVNLPYIMVTYFENVLTLALKLAMPVIAASLITEFCIGVLMKAVPTIHVFVINIQIKMLVGFVVLAASCGVVSEFMDELMGLLFENLNGLLKIFPPTG